MIKEIDGDLLDCEANVLIHQANCQNVMGAGIARQIRDKYPEAFEADCDAHNKLENPSCTYALLGEYSLAKTSDKKAVINLYGQHFYGHDERHTDYEAVARGLNKIHAYLKELNDKVSKRAKETGKEKIKIIAGIPYKMGCNLGGGDWRVVRAIIEAEFEDSPFDVLIVRKE